MCSYTYILIFAHIHAYMYTYLHRYPCAHVHAKSGPDVGKWRQKGGGKSELADPGAKSNEAVVPDMDACLRCVTHMKL